MYIVKARLSRIFGNPRVQGDDGLLLCAAPLLGIELLRERLDSFKARNEHDA